MLSLPSFREMKKPDTLLDVYYSVNEDDEIRVVKGACHKNIENLVFIILDSLKKSDYPRCASLRLSFVEYITNGNDFSSHEFDIVGPMQKPREGYSFVRAASLRDVRILRFSEIGTRTTPLQVVLTIPDEPDLGEESRVQVQEEGHESVLF